MNFQSLFCHLKEFIHDYTEAHDYTEVPAKRQLRFQYSFLRSIAVNQVEHVHNETCGTKPQFSVSHALRE